MKCKKCNEMHRKPWKCTGNAMCCIENQEMQRKYKKIYENTNNATKLPKKYKIVRKLQRGTRNVKKYIEIIENNMENHRAAMGNKNLPA